jgi:hypothetical protein
VLLCKIAHTCKILSEPALPEANGYDDLSKVSNADHLYCPHWAMMMAERNFISLFQVL